MNYVHRYNIMELLKLCLQRVFNDMESVFYNDTWVEK